MIVTAETEHGEADENQTRRHIKPALLHKARQFSESCRKSNTATYRIKFIHGTGREMKKKRSCCGRSEAKKQAVFSSEQENTTLISEIRGPQTLLSPPWRPSGSQENRTPIWTWFVCYLESTKYTIPTFWKGSLKNLSVLCWDSSAGIVTKLWAGETEESEFASRKGLQKESRPILGPTQSPIDWLEGSIFFSGCKVSDVWSWPLISIEWPG